MLIPKYWAKASKEVIFTKTRFSSSPKTTVIHCWRWSDESVADAQRLAEKSIQDRAAQLAAGHREKKEYPQNPVREEILKEFRANDGRMVGAITRSALGFRVLNTVNLAIVDVDFNRSKPFWLFGLFKKKQSPADVRAEWESEAIARIESAYRQSSVVGRLYRTANGLRAFVTSEKISAHDAKCEELLNACHSDALYRKLCSVQESFRARLSPKPRRLHLSSPCVKFPYESEEARAQITKWRTDYEAKQSPFATCEFVKQIGTNGSTLTEFKEILEIHDSETRALERRELK